VTISANSAGRLDELIDFLRRQMLSRSPFGIRRGGATFPFSGVGLASPTTEAVAGTAVDNV
jgi:hypothetical protein